MLFVTGIFHNLSELFKSRDPPDIIRRRTPFPGNAARVPGFGIFWQYLFENYAMLPVIPEIVR
jgi:hypothetical protein